MSKSNTSKIRTWLLFSSYSLGRYCSPHFIPFSASFEHHIKPRKPPSMHASSFPFTVAVHGPSLHFPDNLCSHVFWCLSKQSNTSLLCYIRARDSNWRSSLPVVGLNPRDFRKQQQQQQKIRVHTYLFLMEIYCWKVKDVVYSFWKWHEVPNNFSALLWHHFQKSGFHLFLIQVNTFSSPTHFRMCFLLPHLSHSPCDYLIILVH